MAASVPSGDRLVLERAAEYATMRSFVGRAQAGQGGLLVVEAPAGLGKTTLLRQLQQHGEQLGLVVAQARGSELERQYPYGIVRQLLEPSMRDTRRRKRLLVGAAALAAPVVDPSVTRPADGGADPSAFPVLHGLYWLVASLAQEAPLALLVDDAHLADASSLRFLSFLTRRITELSVLLAVALRPGEADAQVWYELTGEGAAHVIRPEPLSVDAVSILVESGLGAQPSPEFAEACYRSTGGNPFYVGELVRDLAARSIVPSAAESPRVRHLGPPSIARALLFRLASLPSSATPLVRACAVLGDGSRLADCVRLVGMSLAEAEPIADALVRASVLAPGRGLTFAHPIVRAAVEADLGPHERERLHREAAALLNEHGADAEQIALHLLRTAPRGDWATVECLQAAASAAVRKGALDEAAGYLRRALVEPPPPSLPDVVFELGRVEAASGSAEAIPHLIAGLDATHDPVERARRALLVADIATPAGLIPEAVRMLGEAAATLGGGDPDLALLLKAKRFWVGRLSVDTYDQVAGSLGSLRVLADGPDSAGRREVLVYLAMEAMNRDSSGKALELLDLALAPPGLLAFHPTASVVVGSALSALCYLDRLDECDELLDVALAEASAGSDLVGFVILSTLRCWSMLRRGRLVDTAAAVRETLDAAGIGGWRFGSRGLISFLIEALLEQGLVHEAAGVVEAHGGNRDPLGADIPAIILLNGRGRLRLAQGDPQAALRDLVTCGEWMEALAMYSPGIVAWRSSAALAHLALGNRAAAVELAEEELDLARRLAGPSAIGAALRVLGLSRGGEAGIEVLREAVQVLEGANARLEHARALVDLGAALRRTGHRMQARVHLSRGLVIATLAGANGLASIAQEGLLATGARPRRVRLDGVEALTVSERRVARMAADGRSNPEIAQALFVTRKTVEKQLAGAYRKLGIRSRTELATRLTEQDNN